MIRFRTYLLLFIIIFAAQSFMGCEEYILNPDIPEEELVGTWNLTKIIASYPSSKKELSPEEENLTMKIRLNSDKTYNRNQNNRGDIINDSGNWSITNSVLTLVSSEGIFKFPCRLNENILQTTATIIDPDSGNMLPVTLEFTKEP
ncbi:MAG: DUF5004 domain-containing protein [Ignavibacteriaceae bacterium]